MRDPCTGIIGFRCIAPPRHPSATNPKVFFVGHRHRSANLVMFFMLQGAAGAARRPQGLATLPVSVKRHPRVAVRCPCLPPLPTSGEWARSVGSVRKGGVESCPRKPVGKAQCSPQMPYAARNIRRNFMPFGPRSIRSVGPRLPSTLVTTRDLATELRRSYTQPSVQVGWNV
jgi:hypothetical protein